jgi:hypothetical protein
MAMFEALGLVQVSAAPYVATILTGLAICVLALAALALRDSEQDTWLARAVRRAWPRRHH